MIKNIVLTFDFGMKGDYEGLFKWLDENNAEERGYGVAVIPNYHIDKNITTDLGLLNSVSVVITPVLAVTTNPFNEVTPVNAPNDNVIAGVVVGLSTLPETPWLVTTDKSVTVPPLEAGAWNVKIPLPFVVKTFPATVGTAASFHPTGFKRL